MGLCLVGGFVSRSWVCVSRVGLCLVGGFVSRGWVCASLVGLCLAGGFVPRGWDPQTGISCVKVFIIMK